MDKDKQFHKTWSTVCDINKEGVREMHYQFGANQLNIGDAIVGILEKLERDFNLNFDELIKIKK